MGGAEAGAGLAGAMLPDEPLLDEEPLLVDPVLVDPPLEDAGAGWLLSPNSDAVLRSTAVGLVGAVAAEELVTGADAALVVVEAACRCAAGLAVGRWAGCVAVVVAVRIADTAAGAGGPGASPAVETEASETCDLWAVRDGCARRCAWGRGLTCRCVGASPISERSGRGTPLTAQ